MRRDPLGKLVVALSVVLLGLAAWITQHPESRLVEGAEDWPLVGPAVRAFRARYLPTVSERADATSTAADSLGEPPQASSDSLSGEGAVERAGEMVASAGVRPVWVLAGTRLRAEPEADSRVVLVVPEVSRLPVLEQSADWYRLRYGSRAGWVELPGYGTGEDPPLGSEPEPPGPLPGRVADAELLATATALLNQPVPSRQLGDYRFLSDSQDVPLERLLARSVAALEDVYAERYGVEPIDGARETVVLFSSQDAYRELQNGVQQLAGLAASGLASRGLVAAYVGHRDRAEVASTIVHEVTHLLNRRALGPALPPWLDEGLAGDLAYSRIGNDGVLDPQALGGSSRVLGATRIWWGGQAALLELARALHRPQPPSVEALLHRDWEEFVSGAERRSYPHSGFFIRYLLADSPRTRRGLRAFLRDVARGLPPTAEALRTHLDLEWQTVDQGLADWVEATLESELGHELPTSSSLWP